MGAQNWQNLNAEEGNGNLDQRHKVSGTYLYELPFGQDKRWFTAGKPSHVLEGFSASGTFTFATGTPLNPYYAAEVSSVALRHSRNASPRSCAAAPQSPPEGDR